MAYSKNSVVLASDYNNFVGVAASATVDTVNTVWAVGQGDKGYGQDYLPQIDENDTVGIAEWNDLRTQSVSSLYIKVQLLLAYLIQ